MNKLILSKLEIERLLEFAKEHEDDNVVLYCETNEIGTEYAVQTQSDMIAQKKNYKFITNWEKW